MVEPTHRLNIDIETYSAADLRKVGVYKYTDDPTFKILLFAYSVDGGPVELIDMTKDKLPVWLADALIGRNYLKIAFNAQFERIALTHLLREPEFEYLAEEQWLDPRQWHDTMVQVNELGLPSSLKYAAQYLHIEAQKDTRGTALINYFSKPGRDGKRHKPEDAPEKWQTFGEYNVQDVYVEMAIADKLAPVPVKDSEWELWAMDQRINDRGVGIDTELADGAIAIMDAQNASNLEKLKDVTELENPNSLKQFKEWLAEHGVPMEKLGKALVQEALKSELPDKVRTALELRLTLSNTSTKKYEMMENARTKDGRIHGLLQFYGASRTGRWAGRLLQVQNLPRNYIKQLDDARELVKERDANALEMVFGSAPGVLKELIRTGLVPDKGNRFLVADFSAIEARVIAWYAKEGWTLEAFRTHGKIYEATASQMFDIPLDEIDKQTRQKGKVATLALGYQGGTHALEAMGALSMSIPEEELPELVEKWRKANKNIVKFWYAVEKAAIGALESKGSTKRVGPLKFFYRHGWLFITLPSGRNLAYAHARLEPGKFDRDHIVYDGQGDRVQFAKLDTYGGKLVENIVQATARDLLAGAMLHLEEAGYPTIFHIHDEVVVEAWDKNQSLTEMVEIMTRVPEWAEGLPLNAAGFETNYYRKD